MAELPSNRAENADSIFFRDRVVRVVDIDAVFLVEVKWQQVLGVTVEQIQGIF
jgi:hypothetical protein